MPPEKQNNNQQKVNTPNPYNPEPTLPNDIPYQPPNLKPEDIDRINKVMARWSGSQDYQQPVNQNQLPNINLPSEPVTNSGSSTFNRLAYILMGVVITLAILLVANLIFHFLPF